jgi:hypothetical protein
MENEMRALRTVALAIVAVSALLATRAASGQATKTEMEHFPMPPERGYHATKTFTGTGDSGYYTSPVFACVGGGASPNDYRYVRYSGVSNRRVVLYGAWGTTDVPPAEGGGDACFHSHVSYGVWANVEFDVPWVEESNDWFLAGGGSMSGVRNSAGKCEFRTENAHVSFDDRFGWGDEFEEFDFRTFGFVKALVLGVQANTHGWGTCMADGFLACREPAYLIGYVLP